MFYICSTVSIALLSWFLPTIAPSFSSDTQPLTFSSTTSSVYVTLSTTYTAYKMHPSIQTSI